MMGDNLDFNTLDDLALGIEGGRTNLPRIAADRLGPVVEAISLSSKWRQRELAKFNWLQKEIFEPLLLDARSARTQWQRTGTLTGWIVSDQFTNSTHWTGFLMRVSAAINSRELDKRTKEAIIATFGEFQSNVLEHARAKGIALAAFHANRSEFELTVMDQGQGVLASIRENQNYETLTDAGRALKLAITDGVSRYDDPQRGYGFNHLFEGLANRFNHIRLRSGDHALEVFREDGKTPHEYISQKAYIPGFFIYAQIGCSYPTFVKEQQDLARAHQPAT